MGLCCSTMPSIHGLLVQVELALTKEAGNRDYPEKGQGRESRMSDVTTRQLG